MPTFGIFERKGMVVVKIVPGVGIETLLKQVVKTVRRGSMIFTDKSRSYSNLVVHGFRHEMIDKLKRFANGKVFDNGKVYDNGIDGFWSYAKNNPCKFRGVSSGAFPLYIKELEVRCNSSAVTSSASSFRNWLEKRASRSARQSPISFLGVNQAPPRLTSANTSANGKLRQHQGQPTTLMRGSPAVESLSTRSGWPKGRIILRRDTHVMFLI